MISPFLNEAAGRAVASGRPPHGRVHTHPIRTHPQGATLRRRGTQRPPHTRPQPLAVKEWSQRAKLAGESISCALLLEDPLGGAVGRTRHFDPSPFAIAEVIFASSG